MSRVDFAAGRKLAEREGHIVSGDRFKFKEGPNRIRVLSVPLAHPGEYNGSPNFKWLCYVLDRADGQIKTFFMPHRIYKDIEALQETDDYAFDEVPMPYDIQVTAVGAGTKEVKYTVIPARKNVPLTAAEITALDAKKPIEEVQAAMRLKAGEIEQPAQFERQTEDDDLPF